jgi:hypothetical protein
VKEKDESLLAQRKSDFIRAESSLINFGEEEGVAEVVLDFFKDDSDRSASRFTNKSVLGTENRNEITFMQEEEIVTQRNEL